MHLLITCKAYSQFTSVSSERNASSDHLQKPIHNSHQSHQSEMHLLIICRSLFTIHISLIRAKGIIWSLVKACSQFKTHNTLCEENCNGMWSWMDQKSRNEKCRVPGSWWSMYGYVLAYHRLKGTKIIHVLCRVWKTGAVMPRWRKEVRCPVQK